MARPGPKTPRDPRESQLIGNYDSTNGVSPYAPAGGGGPGGFTSRKSHGDASAAPFQSKTGPQAAKESSWITSLNDAFAEVENAVIGVVDDVVETERRAENVVKAYFLARYKYVWQMIFEETGRSLKEFLDGLIQGLMMMLIVVAASTVLGTAIGAAIGALFGGVGAGPGALIGAEAGLDFGIFVLNWLGIGFLIVYVAANFGEILKLISAGVERAWYAGKRLQSEQTDIDEAAKDIARGIAVLFRLILEGIVMYLLAKGTAAVAERLPGLIKSLKDSKLGKGFAEWVEKNHKSLIEDPKTNPQLRAKDVEMSSSVGESSGGSKQTIEKAAKPKDAQANKTEAITKPAPITQKTQDHIFKGEINKKGNATGFHYEGAEMEASNATKVVEGTRSAPDANGVYSAEVVVEGVPKGPESTFFPKEWSKNDVLTSVNEAYTNRAPVTGGRSNYFEGKSSSGVTIGMYTNPDGTIATAFPIYGK